MIKSCLRNFLNLVGCLSILVVGAGVAWFFRTELVDYYRARTGTNTIEIESETVARGRPSREALVRALEKSGEIERVGGPESVRLSADELAAMIEDGLTFAARSALDSMSIVLGEDMFTFEGVIATDVFSRRSLGPLADLVRDHERVTITGTASVAGTGVVRWRPERAEFRAIPIPGPLLRLLVNAATGGLDGSVPLVVPSSVRRLSVDEEGLTFYRSFE